MSIIYAPRGKAAEYADLAANIWKGCGHACSYCYAPSATFTPKEKFSSNRYIKHRPNILTQLEKDANKFSGDTRKVLLSFTSDLYQPLEVKNPIARDVLNILNNNNVKFTVLTKGGTFATRDFDLYAKGCEFACTITSDNDDESKLWEPFAASPANRIESLKIAHSLGIKTWVSFEPVINPSAVLRIIPEIHNFIDLFKVGKLNYHPFAQKIDWKKFLFDVESALSKFNKPYIIKKDLESYRSK